MFQIRHHFQLLHINKFINGKGLLSNWQRLSTIYGRQFSAIQSSNSRSCIIQYKYQQFCQRNQFCTGNDDVIHPLRAVENIDFSSTISSSENQINNAIEQKEQCLEGTEKRVDDHLTLETRFLWLGINNKKQLKLKLEKGKSGQKFFYITLYRFVNHEHFTKIPVPDDAYSFVRALDKLIGGLAAEDFEQKFQTQDIKSNAEIGNANHQLCSRSKLKLQTVEMIGKFHKFQLELILFINTDRRKTEKQIGLRFCTVHKITAKERPLILPLQALPWLRKEMAEMLIRHDETEKIAKEAPAQILKQFFLKRVFHAHPTSNGISADFSLDHKGRQPHNKKPASFQKYSKMPAKMQNSNQIVQRKPNLKRPKIIDKNTIERLDPQMTALEQGIRTLFDFDDKDMEKYRRIAAKAKYPTRH